MALATAKSTVHHCNPTHDSHPQPRGLTSPTPCLSCSLKSGGTQQSQLQHAATTRGPLQTHWGRTQQGASQLCHGLAVCPETSHPLPARLLLCDPKAPFLVQHLLSLLRPILRRTLPLPLGVLQEAGLLAAAGGGRPLVATLGHNMTRHHCFCQGQREVGTEGPGRALPAPCSSLRPSRPQVTFSGTFRYPPSGTRYGTRCGGFESVGPDLLLLFIGKQLLSPYCVLCLCGYWSRQVPTLSEVRVHPGPAPPLHTLSPRPFLQLGLLGSPHLTGLP